VVIDHGDILVIRRRKDGREYAVLPGGGVELGESPEEACLRELFEETGLRGALGKVLSVEPEETGPAFYFSVTVESRRLALGDPEASRLSQNNYYQPDWVPKASVGLINLVPESARSVLSE
jgi:8-oxo-dGTP diphosphatase